MAGDGPPLLHPLPPSAQPAAPPSLRSTSPTTANLTPSFEHQTYGELPAAGEVLGDPQAHASGEVDVVLHASGEVGGEPTMSGEVHGELPKKIRKKKSSKACGVRKVTGDSHIEQRDGNKVTTSRPSSKKSTKKVTIVPTAGTKRPLSESSGSSRAKKTSKMIDAKILKKLERSAGVKNNTAIITLFRSPSKRGVCGQSGTSKPRACG